MAFGYRYLISCINLIIINKKNMATQKDNSTNSLKEEYDLADKRTADNISAPPFFVLINY
jgi:hypothetical protein